MRSPPTFIVGTGRCGSTLLSRMIATHPDIVSISEFFGMAMDLGGRASELFPKKPIAAHALWDIIGPPGERSEVLRRHGLSIGSEILYPSQSHELRYGGAVGIPSLLLITIPQLSDSPDQVFDELQDYVLGLPDGVVGEHYQRIFEWIRMRFGGKMWIERSGASLHFMGELHGCFPNARYVHVVRDGRDTACSMRNHNAFRMFMIAELLISALGVDPYRDPDRTRIDRVSSQLRSLLPESFDPTAFDDFTVPLGLTAKLWSDQINSACEIFDALPAAQQLTIRYEDLIANPVEQLTRLTAFLGDEYTNDAWCRDAATQIRRPRSNWRTLSDAEKRVLELACAPGLDTLAARGVIYDRARSKPRRS